MSLRVQFGLIIARRLGQPPHRIPNPLCRGDVAPYRRRGSGISSSDRYETVWGCENIDVLLNTSVTSKTNCFPLNDALPLKENAPL